jgi:hypothetical protein
MFQNLGFVRRDLETSKLCNLETLPLRSLAGCGGLAEDDADFVSLAGSS